MEKVIEITMEISGYNKERESEIMRVCMVEWSFREEDFSPSRGNRVQKRMLRAAALGTLYDGEDMANIVGRIERAVWRANCGMCHVAVGTREVEVHALGMPLPGDEEYERQMA